MTARMLSGLIAALALTSTLALAGNAWAISSPQVPSVPAADAIDVGLAIDPVVDPCGTSLRTIVCVLYEEVQTTIGNPPQAPSVPSVPSLPSSSVPDVNDLLPGISTDPCNDDPRTVLCPVSETVNETIANPPQPPNVGDLWPTVDTDPCNDDPQTILCPVWGTATETIDNLPPPPPVDTDPCGTHLRTIVCAVYLEATDMLGHAPDCLGDEPGGEATCIRNWFSQEFDGLVDCPSTDPTRFMTCLEAWARERAPSCAHAQVGACLKDELVSALPSETARCVAGGYDYCDDDNDGMANGEDDCDDEAGDPPTGCPDSDGDGVIDKEDQCPLEVGKPDTGCPDTDGDGIEDRYDACPRDHGLGRSDGCPDTDGDGVPDHQDQCPTQGGGGTSNGCPEIGPDPTQPEIPGDSANRDNPFAGNDDATEGDWGDGEYASCFDDGAGDGNYCPGDSGANPMEALVVREPSLNSLTDVEDALAGATGSTLDGDRRPNLQPNGAGWGLATQQSGFFGDGRFVNLGLTKLRRTVPWDVVLREQRKTSCDLDNAQGDQANHNEYVATRKFLTEASQLQGVDIQIAFERCKNSGEWDVIPSVAEYDEAVRAFRREFNDPSFRIMSYSAWNEPSHKDQPTSKVRRGNTYAGAKQAAWYWRHLKRACDNVLAADAGLKPCIPVAGDFNDPGTFHQKYFTEYKRGLAGRRPNVWGFHPYSTGRQRGGDPNRFKRFADHLPNRTNGEQPVIWITEAAGVYDAGFNDTRRPNSYVNDDLRYLLGDFIDDEDDITRFYYYGWKGPADDTFDSHMIAGKTDSANNDKRNYARDQYRIFKRAATGS